MNIRPLRAADMEPLAAAVQRGGWGDLRRQLAFYLAFPDCHPLLAEVDAAPAGTATAVRKADVGWLAHVFVAPECRGRGLGTALVQCAVEQLETIGCRAVLLAATAMGRPIYEKLGFAPEGEYAIYTGSAEAELVVPAGLRRLTSSDLPAVGELDRQATGEDRSRLLAWLGRDGWVALDEDSARVIGAYVPTPWDSGAIVAATAEAGRRLLELRRGLAGRAGLSELSLPLPADNPAARDYLLTTGFREQRRTTRMRRGAPVAWRPEAIWGIFSLGMG